MSTDLNKLSRNALSAAMRGGAAEWGQVGSANEHIRYSEPINSRKRCTCGCKTRRTHAGMANGVALMSGCQLRVTRWVRGVIRSAAQRGEEGGAA